MILLYLLLGLAVFYAVLWIGSLAYILHAAGLGELRRRFSLVTIVGLAPLFAITLSMVLSVEEELSEVSEA